MVETKESEKMEKEFPEIPSKEEIMSWIIAICDKGYRRPGSSASHKVEQLLFNQLKEFGFDEVIKQEFETPYWQPEKWEFKYKIENKIHHLPCFYTFLTSFTDPKGVSGELIYVGDGTVKDFQGKEVKGKIVVVDLRFYEMQYQLLSQLCLYVHNPNKENLEAHNAADTGRFLNWDAYHRAAEKGAVGFVGILTNYPLDSPILYHPAEALEDLPRPIPGIYLGKGYGKKLKKQLKDNEKKLIEGTLILTGEETTSTTSNIIGILQGKSEDIISMGSHHDAPFHNAVQDASGVSIILALAKYFAQIPKENRNKTLLCLLSTGHFYGQNGPYVFFEKYPELISRVLASVHVEHIGLEPMIKDGQLFITDKPKIRGLFVSEIPVLQEIAKTAIIDNNLELTGIMPTNTEIGVWTDAEPFCKKNIPVFSFICGPFTNFHPLHTIRSVAVEPQEPVTKTFIDIINKLDALPNEKFQSELISYTERLV